MSFRAIRFPDSYTYSSDSEHIPLEFYNAVFPVSKTVDLFLGYFNTGAFRVLSESFAEFIYNGGSMRMITNHYYTKLDFENLIAEPEINDYGEVSRLIKDLRKLKEALDEYGQHFFDCLKYLIKENRLQIQPVSFGKQNLSHSKQMLFYDGQDYILTQGSMNFTLAGIVKNSESFQVEVPWNSEVSQVRIEEQRQHFDKVFNQKHPDYNYLKRDDIQDAIDEIGEDKSMRDLLETSKDFGSENYSIRLNEIRQAKKEKFKQFLEKIDNEPHFPIIDGEIGEPRDYQKQAYKNWVENDYKGVFAMATGTGKTITSLNCVLNLFKIENKYQCLILVPSISLLNQWEKEVSLFNFKKVLKIGGSNRWEKELANYVSNFIWDIKDDLVIISTYDSFISDRVQKYYSKIQKDFLLIADEAHNIGAKNRRKCFDQLSVERKIGLSATPKRVYDPEGTDALNSFFNDKSPFTYSFTMEQALLKGYLCNYKYYPKIVELDEDEFQEYRKITKKLMIYFDSDTGSFKNSKEAEMLLLRRKNIIHKASGKVSVLINIISELVKKNKCKYVFTYVPEGFDKGQETRIINSYMEAISNKYPDLKMNTYINEENVSDLIRAFKEGKIDLLMAMKMLDEGVDVPRAEVGIFASSTGNPRQYIQRRGRLLRRHQDKTMSTIYDMIVIPGSNNLDENTFNIERSLVKNELRRVGHFASLAINYYDSRNELENICSKYELNLDQIIEEL